MHKLTFQRFPAIAVMTVLTIILAGCSSVRQQPDAQSLSPAGVNITKQQRFLGFLSPYRPDMQQGNFVSKEMAEQVKPGMSRAQVQFALGTPLLADIFHADRWDYDFRLVRGNGEVLTSRVTAYFNGDVLDRLEGADNLPTEQAYLSMISGKPADTSSDQ